PPGFYPAARVVRRQPIGSDRACRVDVGPRPWRAAPAVGPEPRPTAAHPRSHVERGGISVPAWNSCTVATAHGSAVPYGSGWHRILRGVRTGRIADRFVRWEFQLARAGMVSRELPADRGPAEVSPLLRSGFHGGVPDRLGLPPDAGGGGRGVVAPGVTPVLAR